MMNKPSTPTGLRQNIPKTLGQINVVYPDGIGKERRDVGGLKACYATANGRNKKHLLRMLRGILNKLVDVRLDGFGSSLHGGNGVAAALRSHTDAHLGPKIETGGSGGTSAVHALEVAAKHKDLIGSKRCDVGWRDTIRMIGLHSRIV